MARPAYPQLAVLGLGTNAYPVSNRSLSCYQAIAGQRGNCTYARPFVSARIESAFQVVRQKNILPVYQLSQEAASRWRDLVARDIRQISSRSDDMHKAFHNIITIIRLCVKLREQEQSGDSLRQYVDNQDPHPMLAGICDLFIEIQERSLSYSSALHFQLPAQPPMALRSESLAMSRMPGYLIPPIMLPAHRSSL